jgi:hypothetical protein
MQNDQGWIRQGLQLALVECLGPSKTNGAYSKGWHMAIEKLAARPTTKREVDVAALRLFCFFAFILVALILAGIL